MNLQNYHLLIGILIGAELVSSCSRTPKFEAVAQVNDRLITANEYSFAYELAPRRLTSLEKNEARHAVLDQIIDRILLAQAAEKEGLAADSIMERAIDLYTRLAVNRELYLKHIRNPIKIDEPEARRAFQRTRETLFVRHFACDSKSAADELLSGALQLSHSPIEPEIETVDLENYGKVDRVKWNDVNPDIEEILFNLPLHTLSQPYYDGRKYHVFEVVEKETEVLLRENDFYANYESLRGILRKRQENRSSAQFIQNIMTPQHLVIKAEALNRLTEYLWRKRPASSNPQFQSIGDAEINFVRVEYPELANQTIAQFRDGTMSVSDILFYYKVNPQRIGYESKDALRKSLKNAVSVFVRDRVLSEIGLREKLDRQPSVTEERQTRREHLLAHKQLNHIYRNIASRSNDSTLVQQEFDDSLKTLLKQLRSEASITVNEQCLMAINTSDEGLSRKVDFVAVYTQ
jgi:hypothetical protein